MIRIGVTGADGFIGQHARFALMPLQKSGEAEVECFARSDWGAIDFAERLARCDAVLHLAGMNRGKDEEVYETNVRLAKELVAACDSVHAKPRILFSSSTHADRDSAYGRAKKECSAILSDWGARTGTPVTIFILPHVFGEFARPYGNSAVATLCHELAENLPSSVHADARVELVYVGDVVARMILAAQTAEQGEVRIQGNPARLVDIYAMLTSWCEMYRNGVLPKLDAMFERHLFMTLHSVLFWKEPVRMLVTKADDRGRLVEMVRHDGEGQVFASTTRPGFVRGNHYHTRKLERFFVTSGTAEVRIRKLLGDQVHVFALAGTTPSVMDMPSYHAHSLVAKGEEIVSATFWISEKYTTDDPDTFSEIP